MVEGKVARRPRKEATLYFPDQEGYEDVEIQVLLSTPFRVYFELERLGEQDDPREMFQFFLDEAVLSWNLVDDDGTPVPLTIDGLLSWPPELTAMMIPAYKDAMVKPHSPLPETNGMVPDEMELELGNMSRPG